MHFALVIAVCIAFAADTGNDMIPMALGATAERMLATLCGVAFVSLFAMVIATAVSGQLLRQFALRHTIMPLYNRLRWIHTVIALGVYAVIIHVVQWPEVVRQNWGLAGWVVVDELLILMPFLVPVLLSWAAFYRVDRVMRLGLAGATAQRPKIWSCSQYVAFHVRHYLALVLVPVCCFFAFVDLSRRYWPRVTMDPGWNLASLAGLGLALMALSPLLIRWIWGARPLPPGPLRNRLEHSARRLGFRYTDILVWETGGGMVNAAVTGIFGGLRYVLISDALIQHLSDDEIDAVFGHEAGHIRHHHMLFYFLFVLASVFALGFVAEAVESALACVANVSAGLVQTQMSSHLPVLLLLIGIYFGVVFGFVSRRFERQADIFGCLAVSCPPGACVHTNPLTPSSGRRASAVCPAGVRAFTSALEKIAYLNGTTRNARSWRHASIARRVAFLHSLLDNPQAETAFRAAVLRVKVGVVLLVIGATAYVVHSQWLFG